MTWIVRFYIRKTKITNLKIAMLFLPKELASMGLDAILNMKWEIFMKYKQNIKLLKK